MSNHGQPQPCVGADAVQSVERLRQALHYDPQTGVFARRVNSRRRPNMLLPTGATNGKGYVVLSLDGKRIYAHRAAWAYVTGEWPPEQIDHINRLKSDNRFSNLRLATASENQQNHPLLKPSRSGYRGVAWAANVGKWVARIRVPGRERYLGVFDQKEEAAAAYRAAARQFHTHSEAGEANEQP